MMNPNRLHNDSCLHAGNYENMAKEWSVMAKNVRKGVSQVDIQTVYDMLGAAMTGWKRDLEHHRSIRGAFAEVEDLKLRALFQSSLYDLIEKHYVPFDKAKELVQRFADIAGLQT